MPKSDIDKTAECANVSSSRKSGIQGNIRGQMPHKSAEETTDGKYSICRRFVEKLKNKNNLATLIIFAILLTIIFSMIASVVPPS
ncbi:MAG: hypothetical protein LBL82_02935 [Oscillospiraceae bacterium]|jgi:hypothetical protein|nr:hypothetical protein [Oscillospiraceae bacterium]